MKEDLIDWLIKNPQEIPTALKMRREKYGIHDAQAFETAIEIRRRHSGPANTKGVIEMINSGTRAIAGDDYNFGIASLEQQLTSNEDVAKVVKMVNQGTSDILENPGMSSDEAIALGRLRREVKGI